MCVYVCVEKKKKVECVLYDDDFVCVFVCLFVV